MSLIDERKPKAWATGVKLKFLERQLEDYRKAQEIEAVSQFYTRVTRLWINKFGHHFDPFTEVKEDSPDPIPELFKDVIDISIEETVKRRDYFNEMRKVSRVLTWLIAPKVSDLPFRKSSTGTIVTIPTWARKLKTRFSRPSTRWCPLSALRGLIELGRRITTQNITTTAASSPGS